AYPHDGRRRGPSRDAAVLRGGTPVPGRHVRRADAAALRGVRADHAGGPAVPGPARVPGRPSPAAVRRHRPYAAAAHGRGGDPGLQVGQRATAAVRADPGAAVPLLAAGGTAGTACAAHRAVQVVAGADGGGLDALALRSVRVAR